jgi:hypothetical protein
MQREAPTSSPQSFPSNAAETLVTLRVRTSARITSNLLLNMSQLSEIIDKMMWRYGLELNFVSTNLKMSFRCI